MSDNVPDKIVTAGFTSVEDARRALANLRARRERAIDGRISVSSIGGNDLGGGMQVEQWRAMNDAIDAGASLADIESQIRRLEEALS